MPRGSNFLSFISVVNVGREASIPATALLMPELCKSSKWYALAWIRLEPVRPKEEMERLTNGTRACLLCEPSVSDPQVYV